MNYAHKINLDVWCMQRCTTLITRVHVVALVKSNPLLLVKITRKKKENE
jgi:hypothetical protein